MWWLAAILDLLITETSNQNENVPTVLSMVENPHLDILHDHSNISQGHSKLTPVNSQHSKTLPNMLKNK